MANISLVANDEDIKEIYSILSKDLKVVKRKSIIFVYKGEKVISKIQLNEYDTIINLKLPRKYGYLNNYILSKLMGLVYKEKTTE